MKSFGPCKKKRSFLRFLTLKPTVNYFEREHRFSVLQNALNDPWLKNEVVRRHVGPNVGQSAIEGAGPEAWPHPQTAALRSCGGRAREQRGNTCWVAAGEPGGGLLHTGGHAEGVFFSGSIIKG